MSGSAYSASHTRSGVCVYDADAIAWRATNRAGVSLKSVRRDDRLGHYLGLVGFEPFARSGLHQHLGLATSFFLSGSLTDYHCSTSARQVGINLAGTTHDAVSYEGAVLVSRLEGPVLYAEPVQTELAIHAGGRHAQFDNPHPERPPEIIVPVDQVPALPSGVDGLHRQLLFDYAATGDDRRMMQLMLRPGTILPPWRSPALIECWVRGGALEIVSAGGKAVAHANGFVIIEPDTEVRWRAPYGALLLVWAEGPAHWSDAAGPEPFGFGPR